MMEKNDRSGGWKYRMKASVGVVLSETCGPESVPGLSQMLVVCGDFQCTLSYGCITVMLAFVFTWRLPVVCTPLLSNFL